MAKVTVPEGSEQRRGLESVSSPPNGGRVNEAQPTVDAGIESSKPGYWIGDGADIRRIEA